MNTSAIRVAREIALRRLLYHSRTALLEAFAAASTVAIEFESRELSAIDPIAEL